MSDTIQLISLETARKPFWDQYFMLTKELEKTEGVLRSLGVTEFPSSRDNGAQSHQNEAKQTAPRQTHKKSRQSPFGLSVAIRDAAQEICTAVTRDKIADLVKLKNPDAKINEKSLSALVSAIAKEDKWILVEKGVGGKQSVYDLF